ncbi:hypothetical protein PFICI_09450 [Pestalotiopsis fici W106-1]|uniref:tRNA pseudouridine(55) synthase n=1 Tax=Pestalotiopsis fici (strain W106-1 / CGMCC3.15140) TaxID=1229662 RepID=W3X2H3_PESFW|nr:uncharacterized protein PFICI_09450 [Pestalotiopsis fici W106-1]ETS79597.1 hypothetical protein PFICI_09450 [Pestalotiopsis fici W106-1]
MAASKPVLDGLFAVNKPTGMSSAQVIRDCQEQFNPSTFFKPMIDEQRAQRGQESNTKKRRRGYGKNDIRVKMGHGGTLDPLATGVLILGLGKGTKSLQSFLDCTKTYETVVLFGASTDTYDRVGKILKKTSYDHITKPMVEEALNGFRGKLQQMPPLYSALKMEGKPLYEYAREGKPIPREIATREVTVTDLELVEYYEPGTHDHRWPAEDATQFEKSFAEQVWKIEKDQMTKEKRTPEEEEEEKAALERYERVKQKADERVDELVYDKNNKRHKKDKSPPMMMSGALGDHPPEKKQGKGSNLLPPPHDPNTPPPWTDKGPPAARIRMTVTSGFYVRSFCHDLGAKIGSSAMMAELSRSRQGDFKLGTENCLEYHDIMKGEEVWAPQVEAALMQWHEKSKPGAAQAPKRAEPVTSPKLKSIESPPAKRKASEEPASEEVAPKRKKSKSASPQPRKKTEKDTEEEWKGFDDPAVPQQDGAKA